LLISNAGLRIDDRSSIRYGDHNELKGF
jgi:hypothetical protein